MAYSRDAFTRERKERNKRLDTRQQLKRETRER